jgi:hypothetical protein
LIAALHTTLFCTAGTNTRNEGNNPDSPPTELPLLVVAPSNRERKKKAQTIRQIHRLRQTGPSESVLHLQLVILPNPHTSSLQLDK